MWKTKKNATIKLNEFGNVNINDLDSQGLKYFESIRVRNVCKKLKIEFAPVFHGFKDSKKYYQPIIRGIALTYNDAQLPEIIAAASIESVPRADARQRRERQKQKQKKLLSEDIEKRITFKSVDQEILLSFATYLIDTHGLRGAFDLVSGATTLNSYLIAHVRHKFTDYEETLEFGDEDFREDCRKKAIQILQDKKAV